MRARGLIIAVLLGTLASAGHVAAQSLSPAFPGWERYFAVTSDPFERQGQLHLRGYIVNSYGVLASRVQLLVDSLDASGRITAQRVEWLVGDSLPGFSRTYFEVPVRERAAAYRVSVFAFSFIQASLVESP